MSFNAYHRRPKVKMHRLCTVIFICLIIIGAEVCPLYAQGSTEEQAGERMANQEMVSDEVMAARETMETIEGEVVGVNGAVKSLTVREADPDEYEDSDFGNSYFIKSDTTFTNARSLTDIEKGDQVTLDYFVVNDKRIIDSIIVDEKVYKEESTKSEDKVPKVLKSE